MNITEYSKYLKSKFAQVMTNWDKLTINQLEQIERIVNDVLPPAEEEPKEPTPVPNGRGFKRCKNLMNDTIYNDMKNLRSLGWTWDNIAKKYGYMNGVSACASCNAYKRRNLSIDKI